MSGKPRMALFAGERGIMTGEELTYDYNFDPYSQKNVQACRCGAANCRGFLGPKQKDHSKKSESSEEEAPVVRPQKKEGKFAGAKRKVAEVLEESAQLVNNHKKKKVDKNNQQSSKLSQLNRRNSGSVLERKPSKLKRLLNTKSRHSMPTAIVASGSSRRSTRLVSGTSTRGLLESDHDEVESPVADENHESDSKQAEAEQEDEMNGKRVLSETHLRALAIKERADRLMRSHGRKSRVAG